MSGVTAVAGDAAHAWVVRAIVPPPGLRTAYQLAGINLNTDVMFRRIRSPHTCDRRGQRQTLADNSNGQHAGRSSGSIRLRQVLSSIHLHAGPHALVFGFGHLAPAAAVKSPGTEFGD
jgi:hypothetical protein